MYVWKGSRKRKQIFISKFSTCLWMAKMNTKSSKWMAWSSVILTIFIQMMRRKYTGENHENSCRNQWVGVTSKPNPEFSLFFYPLLFQTERKENEGKGRTIPKSSRCLNMLFHWFAVHKFSAIHNFFASVRELTIFLLFLFSCPFSFSWIVYYFIETKITTRSNIQISYVLL